MSEAISIETKFNADILKSISPGNRFRLAKAPIIDQDKWYLVTSVLSNNSAVARAVGAIPMPNSKYHQSLDKFGSQPVQLFSVDQIGELESVWSVDIEKAEICFKPINQIYKVVDGNIFDVDEGGGRVSYPYGRDSASPVRRALELYNIVVEHQVKGKAK